MEERNVCPYCGESIAKTAKKCRYCGEWLHDVKPVNKDESSPLIITPSATPNKGQSLEPVDKDVKASVILKSVGSDKISVTKIIKSHFDLGLVDAKKIVDSVDEGKPFLIKKGLQISDAEHLMTLLEDKGAEVSIVPERDNNTPTVATVMQTPTEAVPTAPTSSQSPQPYQQPQIVVNVVNNQSVEQNVSQEQTTVVNQATSSDKSAPGWIYGEMFFLGGVVWGITGSWVLGVVAWLGGSALFFIPFIGAILCWALGIAWGILLGIIAYAIFHSVAAGWIIGIIAAWGIGYGHHEAREKNIKEVNEQ